MNEYFTPIIARMLKFTPLALAESWDSVGLLIDVPPVFPSQREEAKAVLLTNDFTSQVLEECVQKRVGLVICYHPVIFQSIARLNSSENWKARLIVGAVQRGISIFCPHTAADACKRGVNDWLCQAFSTIEKVPVVAVFPIKKSTSEEEGAGRILELSNSICLSEACELLKKHLHVQHLRTVAGKRANSIKRIAFCAGSGASLFKEIPQWWERIDLFVTGEAGHHFALDVLESGSSLVLCEHSTSERGWLRDVLKPELEQETGFEILISEADQEPIQVV